MKDNFESKLGFKLETFFKLYAAKTKVKGDEKRARGEYECIFLSHYAFVQHLDVVKLFEDIKKKYEEDIDKGMQFRMTTSQK